MEINALIVIFMIANVSSAILRSELSVGKATRLYGNFVFGGFGEY